VGRVEEAVHKDDTSWAQPHLEGTECRCGGQTRPGACSAEDHPSWGLAAHTSNR
jgi:hypothetical protein